MRAKQSVNLSYHGTLLSLRDLRSRHRVVRSFKCRIVLPVGAAMRVSFLRSRDLPLAGATRKR